MVHLPVEGRTDWVYVAPIPGDVCWIAGVPIDADGFVMDVPTPDEIEQDPGQYQPGNTPDDQGQEYAQEVTDPSWQDRVATDDGEASLASVETPMDDASAPQGQNDAPPDDQSAGTLANNPGSAMDNSTSPNTSDVPSGPAESPAPAVPSEAPNPASAPVYSPSPSVANGPGSENLAATASTPAGSPNASVTASATSPSTSLSPTDSTPAPGSTTANHATGKSQPPAWLERLAAESQKTEETRQAELSQEAEELGNDMQGVQANKPGSSQDDTGYAEALAEISE